VQIKGYFARSCSIRCCLCKKKRIFLRWRGVFSWQRPFNGCPVKFMTVTAQRI